MHPRWLSWHSIVRSRSPIQWNSGQWELTGKIIETYGVTELCWYSATCHSFVCQKTCWWVDLDPNTSVENCHASWNGGLEVSEIEETELEWVFNTLSILVSFFIGCLERACYIRRRNKMVEAFKVVFRAHHECGWSAGITRLPAKKYPQVMHPWLRIILFPWVTTDPGMDLKISQVPAGQTCIYNRKIYIFKNVFKCYCSL